MTLPTSAPVAAILLALVEERTGLHYAPHDHELALSKIAARAEEAGFASLLDYYYYLRYDAESAGEMDALTDALVISETYFFRELEPLQLIADELLPARLGAQARRPRVWSAACATGEEPLTLAMLLAERRLLAQVEIVASDLSRVALARAQRGRYGPRAVRDRVPAFAPRYLTQVPGGWQVDATLTAAVQWRRLNLAHAADIASVAPCDVILCRNVLIYFADAMARRVIGNLTAALAAGGAIFVGVSESLLRFGNALACEERRDVFFYRKVP